MWGAAVKIGYKTGNKKRKITKLVKIVPLECEIMHANFGGDCTTFVKVVAKKLMHPSSQIVGRLPKPAKVLLFIKLPYSRGHTAN